MVFNSGDHHIQGESLRAVTSTFALGYAIQSDQPAGEMAPGMLVSWRTIAQSPEEKQKKTDFLDLLQMSADIERRRLTHPTNQEQQTENLWHSMVRMRHRKPGAEHLAGDPSMGGSGIEPPHHHSNEPPGRRRASDRVEPDATPSCQDDFHVVLAALPSISSTVTS
jgi:hypothetical protein